MDPSQWVNYGVAGLVVILLVTGQLVPGWVHRKLEKALEQSQQALSLERERNSMLQQSSVGLVKVMTSLNEVAEENRQEAGRRQSAQDMYAELVRAQLQNPPRGAPPGGGP